MIAEGDVFRENEAMSIAELPIQTDRDEVAAFCRVIGE